MDDQALIFHFLTGASEGLQYDLPNLERALEDVTIEEFHSFVRQNFSHIKYEEKI